MSIDCYLMATTINQSLVHGLSILLLFDAASPYLSVAEIARRLHYSQSRTYRLIRTLLQLNFLQEKPGAARYGLGLNALRLGLIAGRNLDVTSVARPLMEELATLAKETVLLTAINGRRGICLDRVESEEPVRYSLFRPGADIPLHCGASSTILMAFLSEAEWDRIIAEEGLRRFTGHTITEPETLKAHLREIRRKGYATSDEEADRDVRAVAAPVWNGAGELVAGLSIAGPVYRISKKRMGMLRKWVVDCAEAISGRLGYEGGSMGKRALWTPQRLRETDPGRVNVMVEGGER
jgi:IclR family transcriptional regulator, KDG regulon repressor